MQNNTVFYYSDYRPYLKDRLGAPGTRTGLRQRASKAMGCHNTYLSQVLAEKIDLSLEHTEALNAFLEHGENESEFFLLLVMRSRAGTSALRQRFDAKIKAMLKQRTLIKERILKASEISPADRERFYSHWIYGALHVMVSIEEYQVAEAIARALGLSVARVNQELEFLVNTGLIKFDKGRYTIGPKSIHLGSDSPAIAKHHANWRFHTIQNLYQARPEDLHFSAAVTLSEEAAAVVRESLIKNLETNVKTIEKAKEEVGYVLCFDFYRFS